MSSGEHAGQSARNFGGEAGNFITKGAAKIHGLGDAIRGNINTFADSAVGTDSSKSRAVAERGEEEFKTGHYTGTGAGVTPHDTERERVNREMQGESTTFSHPHTGATGATTGTIQTGTVNTSSEKPPLPERYA